MYFMVVSSLGILNIHKNFNLSASVKISGIFLRGFLDLGVSGPDF